MTYRKKLIEVALPLDEINAASAREKSIRHGHPSTLHLWWARRPLAACRAVLFASLVDDPSSDPSLSESEQEVERERLFQIIRDLVKWENSNNDDVLQAARAEILRCTDGNPPPVLDPFCGGGSIPLEAQRLGLQAHASDLNPVAVLITKAMIEIPPKFAGLPPVNPRDRKGTAQGGSWPRATGLAADVRYYGEWMRDEAFRRIGHLYPKATLPDGIEATVIAWLWARTVTCPNPACGAEMPLIRSFDLSTKKGKAAWVEPVVDQTKKTFRFEVKTGNGKAANSQTVGRSGAHCIACRSSVSLDQIRSQAMDGDMGQKMLAVVADGAKGRAYLSPNQPQTESANSAINVPSWKPDAPLPGNTRDIRPQLYGLPTYGDLFTPRQLVALTTFSDLVGEARERVLADAIAAGRADDGIGIEVGGTGAQAYADAVATYLAFAVDRLADYSSSICSWHSSRELIRNTFGRQAIPMTWDFAEANPLSESSGNFVGAIEWIWKVIAALPAGQPGTAQQASAAEIGSKNAIVISTDPPYYDNIGYADLSDFFYVWLRRSIGSVFPGLLGTRLTPKADEMIASPYRHGGSKSKAQTFFEEGLGASFRVMHDEQNRQFPMSVYYAYKQDDAEDESGSASTGWETMLQGLMDSSLEVTGTWPLRTEMPNRMVGKDANALASSIAIVCRPRPETAQVASRRDFINALRSELETALIELQHASIAPVDLAQASIGPGMRVFSQYARVLEPDGSAMRVRTALQLINQELDATLAAVEGDLDPNSRFCVAWFEENGFAPGQYGQADVLARAKNTTVGGLEQSGVLVSASGKVQLKRPEVLQADWDPVTDRHTNIWECTHQLIRILESEGEIAAGAMLAKLGGDIRERVKALSYRLYGICDRKKWSDLALAYNALGQSWNEIQRTAEASPSVNDQTPKQAGLL